MDGEIWSHPGVDRMERHWRMSKVETGEKKHTQLYIYYVTMYLTGVVFGLVDVQDPGRMYTNASKLPLITHTEHIHIASAWVEKSITQWSYCWH